MRNVVKEAVAHERQLMKMERDRALQALRVVVPETYGEAILKYPWLICEGYTWDNRTTEENAAWFISILLKVAMTPDPPALRHDFSPDESPF